MNSHLGRTPRQYPWTYIYWTVSQLRAMRKKHVVVLSLSLSFLSFSLSFFSVSLSLSLLLLLLLLLLSLFFSFFSRTAVFTDGPHPVCPFGMAD